VTPVAEQPHHPTHSSRQLSGRSHAGPTSVAPVPLAFAWIVALHLTYVKLACVAILKVLGHTPQTKRSGAWRRPSSTMA
jgi:hypothetical protein